MSVPTVKNKSKNLAYRFAYKTCWGFYYLLFVDGFKLSLYLHFLFAPSITTIVSLLSQLLTVLAIVLLPHNSSLKSSISIQQPALSNSVTGHYCTCVQYTTALVYHILLHFTDCTVSAQCTLYFTDCTNSVTVYTLFHKLYTQCTVYTALHRLYN